MDADKWTTNGRNRRKQQELGFPTNGTNGRQMDDKWTTNGKKQCFGKDLAGKDKWESVCLNIRSHLSFCLMPRIGGSSGNK